MAGEEIAAKIGFRYKIGQLLVILVKLCYNIIIFKYGGRKMEIPVLTDQDRLDSLREHESKVKLLADNSSVARTLLLTIRTQIRTLEDKINSNK